MNNIQQEIWISHLKNILKIKDYTLNRLEFLPNSQKYSVQIEVKSDKFYKVYESHQLSLLEVAIDLEDQYYRDITAGIEEDFIRKIERYYIFN